MKLKRGKMLIDPPASASSDIAFILIIFFLVCAAASPIVSHGIIITAIFVISYPTLL